MNAPLMSSRRALGLFTLAAAAAGLMACTDETLTGYGGDKTWHLVDLDGATLPGDVTLLFPAPGKLAGQAPCNRYNGSQSAVYPWFEVKALSATRRACPDLEDESSYLNALQQMSEAEVAGDTLILRNDAGREMVFKTRP